MRQARPLRPGERVDADAASASELARLPRVGLALAKTIVANRDTHGPFGTLAGLDRVPGVGPGLLRSVGGHLSFSGSAARPAAGGSSGAGVGTTFAPLPDGNLAVPTAVSPNSVLNVNRATAVELEGLPGIGPALARRIVADREARGPFATVEALDRVPGIGPALVTRLGKWVSAP